MIHETAGLSHPYLTSTFRGSAEVKARLRTALEEGPWLLGDSYSAADFLVHPPYAWLPDARHDDDLIRDWVVRCMARPARQRTLAADAARLAA